MEEKTLRAGWEVIKDQVLFIRQDLLSLEAH
jgi:hypothetical protein